MLFEGSKDSKILFVSDYMRIQEYAEQKVLSGERSTLLLNSLLRAGVPPSEISFLCIHNDKKIPVNRDSDIAEMLEFLKSHKANVLVPLGGYALKLFTELESIDKWHSSVLATTPMWGTRKCIPLFHPERVQKEYSLIAYVSLVANKLKTEKEYPELRAPKRDFHLNLSASDTINYLNTKCMNAEALGVDFEFSNGQLNCIGFANSPTEAIAIRFDEGYWSTKDQYEIYRAAHDVMESEIPKVIQNAIVERIFAARYGTYLRNTVHDTMWAQKFLFPELEKGLHNVGRIWTPFPYWKDDNDDWHNISNWDRHLEYNAKDTTGTLWAYYEQKKALEQRGKADLFYNYIMKFSDPVFEMCMNGLKVDSDYLQKMRDNANFAVAGWIDVINRHAKEHLNGPINPRSSTQVKALLKSMGVKIPTKHNKKGEAKESADKKALVKLRRQYKDNAVIPALIEIAAENKKLSSYLNFDYDKKTSTVHYQLDGLSTETWRMSGGVNLWGEGFNPQTIPKGVKGMFMARPGKVLMEIDLKSAESYYVAYDSPEPKLMQFLHDNRDIHKYVAANIYKKPEELVNKTERQLGKKSGHAANYGVGPRTFAEACLVEMGIVISEQEAKKIIAGYFEVFPGIKRRQERIMKEIRNTKTITNPLGFSRVFFDRVGDNCFREAFAHAPQSTIPQIMNHLMLFLYRAFDQDTLQFLVQIHDSLLMEVTEGMQYDVAEAARDYKAWHPKIILPGGELTIPVECEWGLRWKPMETI